MSSINELMVLAGELGEYAADRLHGLSPKIVVVPQSNAHHPGYDTGDLVLQAYRSYGVEVVRPILEGYQRGYNARATERQGLLLCFVQITNGVGEALPHATEEERTAIICALQTGYPPMRLGITTRQRTRYLGYFDFFDVTLVVSNQA